MELSGNNYSIFGEDLVDFSRALRLSDTEDEKTDESQVLSVLDSSSGSSSSSRSDETTSCPLEASPSVQFPSGLHTPTDGFYHNEHQAMRLSDLSPSYNQGMASFDVNPYRSVHEGQATIPIWVPPQPLVTGERHRHHLIPAGISYILQAPKYPMLTNQEAYFYLTPIPGQHDKDAKGASQPMAVESKVVHSSGLVAGVELQKLKLTPGYRCSFIPKIPGRYSAKVTTEHPFNLNMDLGLSVAGAVADLNNCDNFCGVPNFPNGLLCAPVEVLVSRNYLKDSMTLMTPQLNLEPNGDKYWGLAVNKFTDQLYVTDRSASEVIVIDPTTNMPMSRFGQLRNASATTKLYRPTGIVVDYSNKRLIICDKDNHRITFFSFDGQFISAVGRKGHGDCEFNYPWDVDVTRNGKYIIVSDSRNHRVQLLDRFGHFVKKFTVFESCPFEYKKHFDYPRGVSFDNDGKNIFVTDFNTNNVLRLGIDSWESKLLVPPGKMMRPQGITVDDMNNVIVCDSRRSCLRIMTSDGDLVSTLNTIGRQVLSVPVAVCILRGSQLAVLDICGRIQTF